MVDWSDENVKRFKAMWESGASKAEIAKAFNTTPNSVTGKAFRLGLRRERKPPVQSPKALKQQAERRAVQFVKARRAPQFECQPLPEETAASLIRTKLWTQRGTNECAYPIGIPAQPADQRCCGHKTTPGQRYCDEHRAVMFEEPEWLRRSRKQGKPIKLRIGAR